MRSVMALCPHPAHSVVLLPRYAIGSRPMRLTFFPGRLAVLASTFRVSVGAVLWTACPGRSEDRPSSSLLSQQLSRHGSAVDWQTCVVRDRAQLGQLRRIALHLEQRQHLAVAVLFDHVDAVAFLDELEDLGRERVRLQPEVRRRQLRFIGQLVARFDDGPVGCAVADDAHLALGQQLDFRLRHQCPRGLELPREPIQILRVVLGTLAVLRLFVVARPAREIRRHAVAGDRAVRDAVAVHVAVAREFADALERVGIQQLAARDRLGRIVEGVRHPRVHAQVEVRHHEDRRLHVLGEVERVHRHRVALGDRAGQQQRVLGVAVRQEGRGQDVLLTGPGRETGGWPAPLDVEDHGRDFGVVAKAGELRHQRNAGTGR